MSRFLNGLPAEALSNVVVAFCAKALCPTLTKGNYVVNSPGHLAEFNRGINPEGVSSSSPGLAFFSQPWGDKEINSQP
jgi:hypothetical protein